VRPRLGTVLKDELTGEDVATITRLAVQRASGRVSVLWEVTGSGRPCERQGDEYVNGWQTDLTDFIVKYSVRYTVYSGGYDSRVRPRRVYFGAHEWIEKLRWSTWNGSVAKGRGIYPTNDCTPDCAGGHFTRRRVLVRFSRPRWCYGAYRYKLLRWTFRDSIPPHWKRSGYTKYHCSESAYP
jgi:hypothetical protein